jgi:hypothetical protein
MGLAAGWDQWMAVDGSGWQKNEVEGIAGESATGDWELGTWKLGTEGAGRFTQYVQNFMAGRERKSLAAELITKGTQ